VTRLCPLRGQPAPSYRFSGVIDLARHKIGANSVFRSASDSDQIRLPPARAVSGRVHVRRLRRRPADLLAAG
jgi:hypothetical protein